MSEQNTRHAPLEMSAEEFRDAGYQVIDRIADFLASLREKPVTPSESPKQIRTLLGSESLPENGVDPKQLLMDTSSMLFEHSLFNGHPAFMGYITSSAAPIGALGDLLAASVNPNLGSFALSPIATEIEAQTVRWIAEMIGYPADCGGLLVSGGNMANFVCFLAARKAKAPWEIRKSGAAGDQSRKLRVYCSTETHTWIQKAADMFGLGTDSIAWIQTDESQRIDLARLRKQIQDDLSKNLFPFLVIGAAGTVSTGAIDPLKELSDISGEFGLWFHVDGAYGGFAAVLPDASDDLKALSRADSIAVDPHKWLYTPLEAGCALVRDPQSLPDTFSYHPSYYRFDGEVGEPPINYYERGPQNSRGFRALKVWLALRQAGRSGYVRMISDDIGLARDLFFEVQKYPELQAYTHGLSITTFRFVPEDLSTVKKEDEEYLNKLNIEILSRLQESGLAYPSNALINGAFVIRVCIVNFRTTREDILSLPELMIRFGREVDNGFRRSSSITSS